MPGYLYVGYSIFALVVSVIAAIALAMATAKAKFNKVAWNIFLGISIAAIVIDGIAFFVVSSYESMRHWIGATIFCIVPAIIHVILLIIGRIIKKEMLKTKLDTKYNVTEDNLKE